MRVRIGDEIRSGRAVDLRNSGVEPGAVAAAIRGDDLDHFSVTCPEPHPVHEYVGFIRPDAALSLRPALAAAARSRGHAAPEDEELAALRDRLDESDPPKIDLASARRRVAEASGAETEARERVATLQGRVRALRETDADASDAEAELADATRRLADLETERIAAEQALARERERAQAHRADRRERLRIRDRTDNLRRAARDRLAGEIRERFETAREVVPGKVDADADGDSAVRTGCDAAPGADTGTIAAATDSVAAALAIARVADLDAPVVLDGDVARFESAAGAAEWLDAPVVRA